MELKKCMSHDIIIKLQKGQAPIILLFIYSNYGAWIYGSLKKSWKLKRTQSHTDTVTFKIGVYGQKWKRHLKKIYTYIINEEN